MGFGKRFRKFFDDRFDTNTYGELIDKQVH